MGKIKVYIKTKLSLNPGVHSAKVLDKSTKAVDAWYPVREDYREP